MKDRDMEQVIEQLRDDSKYYGDLGKKYLSASDIGKLLNDPENFKKQETTLNMVLGRYFHTSLLEPDKIGSFEIIDASTRTTKIYKEALDMSPEPMLLLQKEVDELQVLIDKIKSNIDLHDLIYHPDNVYEEPGVKEIMGEMWKGKADIIGPEVIIDIKTTSDINKFKRSAYIYNYDSQAFIYQQLFNKPVIFLVACKSTHQLRIFDCSDEFLESGSQKVVKAILQYRKFYGDNPTEDVTNFYTRDTL